MPSEETGVGESWSGAVDSNHVPPRCFGLSGLLLRVGSPAKLPALSGLVLAVRYRRPGGRDTRSAPQGRPQVNRSSPCNQPRESEGAARIGLDSRDPLRSRAIPT